jgi:hypothetical protein
MTITLPTSLELTLTRQASFRGIRPEDLVLATLQERFSENPTSEDVWEKQLFASARAYGVTIPNEALSSEGLYE